MTIAEVLAIYLRQLKDEDRDSSVTSQVKPVRRLLGARDAATLRGVDIEDYRAARREEKTIRGGPPEHSTISRELGYLRAALNRALDMELIDRVPRFRMPSEAGAVRTEWCPKEALEKLLGYLRPRHPDVADMVELYFLTGWRKREIMHLRWAEVDFGQRLVLLPPHRVKTRVPRIFPLEGRVAEILERRRVEALDGAVIVFPSPVTGRERDNFRKAWRSAMRAAGRQDLKIHSFRRSFATYQMLSGVPRPVTMRLAGWATDSIYLRYAIVDPEPLRAAVRAQAEYLAGESGINPANP